MSCVECKCTNVECKNYGKCCACVKHHLTKTNLPYCLRDENRPS